MMIRHGETIGVAGRSGCGKTTWLRTLMRLVHPTSGRCLIGGVPLESISREAIGRLVGYVGQNPFVFAGTVAANIAYGCTEATPEQIRHAAELACIHDEIMRMPGGYKARVAERGQNLSGGQRQRIAPGADLPRNPPILILDEGTSALDNISEQHIQQAINAARTDRTVILVAHRLTTLLDTDRILVFEDGQIVETGTYTELVRSNGAFAELVRSAQGEMIDEPVFDEKTRRFPTRCEESPGKGFARGVLRDRRSLPILQGLAELLDGLAQFFDLGGHALQAAWHVRLRHVC